MLLEIEFTFHCNSNFKDISMVQPKTYLGQSLQVFFIGVIELYNCCRLISYKGIM